MIVNFHVPDDPVRAVTRAVIDALLDKDPSREYPLRIRRVRQSRLFVAALEPATIEACEILDLIAVLLPNRLLLAPSYLATNLTSPVVSAHFLRVSSAHPSRI